MSIFRDPRPQSPLRSKRSVIRTGKHLHIEEINCIINALEQAKRHYAETQHDQLWLIIEYNDTNGKSIPTDHYYECQQCSSDCSQEVNDLES